MNKSAKVGVIAAIIIILSLLGGIFFFARDGKKADTNTPQTSQDQKSVATITYSDNGFNPSSLTVSAGDTITIKNASTENLQFSSDNHPAHTNNQELNQIELAPDQSQTITLTKKGIWGYHNHLNPDRTGTITVE